MYETTIVYAFSFIGGFAVGWTLGVIFWRIIKWLRVKTK